MHLEAIAGQSIVALALVTWCVPEVNAGTHDRRASDTILFHHRYQHSSIVSGNYLYIDGGEVATWIGSGTGLLNYWAFQAADRDNGNITTFAEPNTLSIDLSSSWTNDSNPEEPGFYAYNGGLSFTVQIGSNPPNELWQFAPSDKLGRVSGAITASGGGLGFALSGEQSAGTQDGWGTGYMDVSGLVIFKASSQARYNISSTGYSTDGSAINGSAVFGDNGTYEIFMYGGNAGQIDTTISQGVVVVLSLPSFNWQVHSSNATYSRVGHAYNAIGNRQMAIIGGLILGSAGEYDFEPDPWPNGIGIFDMSAFEWSASYDASAAAYVTPDIVKQHYQQNGLYPDSWADPALQEWFVRRNINATTTGSTTSPNPSTSSFANNDGGQQPQSHIGAIAGGVVGGIVACAALLAGVFWLRRHRNPRNSRAAELPLNIAGDKGGEEWQKAELAGQPMMRVEADGHNYQQLGVSELAGSERLNHELSVTLSNQRQRRRL
ncbi:hypothetical protein B0A48_02098 [Cryoendolithus antarcticus]|uniref:Peptidase A1 domain-containing protein n=1 Tax=Cryoendolithus antarcticus TaxID=1507870 RepID=A0A1V8TMP5_9PEZI|nr:hypothetical protein B0A48_02098 [Cryoendolithus antarcticus]